MENQHPLPEAVSLPEQLSVRDSVATAELWNYLLRTDGERGYFTEDGEWHRLRPEGSW